MTVAVAWLRSIKDCQELVFVTDSRLSGDGRFFDQCPKISLLPRSDCVIAFAGFSGHAYPMMRQFALAIDAHAPARRGSLVLAKLKTHALKIFDEMASSITPDPGVSSPEQAVAEAVFLLGGYSWTKKDFQLWTLSFAEERRKFVEMPSKWVCFNHDIGKYVITGKKKSYRRLGKIAFAGDIGRKAAERLLDLLNSRGESIAKLDMEPFEVVRDMLREKAHDRTIGGAPQIAKVYQYMQSAALGVLWPDAKGYTALLGRKLLGYERVENFIIDPDTLVSSQQLQKPRPREGRPTDLI